MRRHRVRRSLLAGMVLGASGCMNFIHPVGTPPPEQAECCRSLPKCGRDHVYIFLVHGMDPLDYANLNGLCDFIHELGFHLRPDHWHRGLGLEAARAVVPHAFDILGARALFAGHHPADGVSRALLR